MQKYTWKITAFILSLYGLMACKSDNNDEVTPNTPAERGQIIETSFIQKLPAGSIATILALLDSSQNFTKDLTYSYDVSLYKITYQTIDIQGNFTPASGLVVIPENITDAPLMSYQHGATMTKTEVPSQRSLEHFLGVTFGTEGYVVALPDYLGLGDSPVFHPFVHAKTEASATIDMMRATRNFCTENDVSLNGEVFLAGYSQGGHATMATIREIETNLTEEFQVKAVASGGAPLDISTTQRLFLMRNEPYSFSELLPYVIYAYDEIYDLFETPSEVFVAPYDETLGKYFTPEMSFTFDDIALEMPASGIAKEILQPTYLEAFEADENHPLRIAMKKNDVYDFKVNVPIKICHCEADEVITVQHAQIATEALQKYGTDVTLVDPAPQANHRTCVTYSMREILKWFQKF